MKNFMHTAGEFLKRLAENVIANIIANWVLAVIAAAVVIAAPFAAQIDHGALMASASEILSAFMR